MTTLNQLHRQNLRQKAAPNTESNTYHFFASKVIRSTFQVFLSTLFHATHYSVQFLVALFRVTPFIASIITFFQASFSLTLFSSCIFNSLILISIFTEQQKGYCACDNEINICI